jgi:hypothetical protein
MAKLRFTTVKTALWSAPDKTPKNSVRSFFTLAKLRFTAVKTTLWCAWSSK